MHFTLKTSQAKQITLSKDEHIYVYFLSFNVMKETNQSTAEIYIPSSPN